MSAFTVTNTHINALVRYASRHKITVAYGNPTMRLNVSAHEQEVAQLLLDENIKSVNYRYSETETGFIEYDRGAPILLAIQAIKAAQCLRYQSCEHPTYEGSIAERLIEAIISDAIPRLEGYNEAQWAIDSTEVTA
jgi:hypothetical protein